MTDTLADRLTGPAYQRLWSRCRDALERTGGEPEGTVSLPSIGADEADALAALLGGRRAAGTSPRVALADLDHALRSGPMQIGLAHWLERIGGPLADRGAEREHELRRRAEPWALLDHHPLMARGWFAEWAEDVRARGLLLSLAPGAESALLADAVAVLAHLDDRDRTSVDGVPLAVVAAEVLGDPKGLNGSCGTLVLRALAIRSGRSTEEESRTLWQSAGVEPDDVSSRVLVLGEPAVGGVPGRARALTLAEIAAGSWRVVPSTVLVCENPAVVMAAARSGLAPDRRLVCTEGQPSDACRRWLSILVDAGCTLAYHGDFDWPGVGIARQLFDRFGDAMSPWRFGARDYLAALSRLDRTTALRGTPGQTPWDPALAARMHDAGRVVYEEQVIDDLVADLATASS